MPNRLDTEMYEIEATEPELMGSPLRAVARLAEAHGDLEPGATDALGRRRHCAAARRLAAAAIDTAACLHGAFADRPGLDAARPRAVAAVRARANDPGPSCARALAQVARLALALPPIADGDDWQLGAIAFADERFLADLYDACLLLAAMAVREAAGA